MALLSNENTLFQELNLISNTNNKGKNIMDNQPNDFYNFLLHKLTNLFDKKVAEGELVDSKAKTKSKAGSYERLSNLLWGRSHVKKSIMTIPYNSSPKSMKKYLAECLVRAECNDDETYWYTVSDKPGKMINDHDLFLLIKCLKYTISNDF